MQNDATELLYFPIMHFQVVWTITVTVQIGQGEANVIKTQLTCMLTASVVATSAEEVNIISVRASASAFAPNKMYLMQFNTFNPSHSQGFSPLIP